MYEFSGTYFKMKYFLVKELSVNPIHSQDLSSDIKTFEPERSFTLCYITRQLNSSSIYLSLQINLSVSRCIHVH